MTLDTTIDVTRESDLSAAERTLFQRWTKTAFGVDEEKYEWASADWRIVVRHQREPVSHVAVLLRTVLAGSTSLDVAGIGGVMTPPTHRGQGLAQRAMNAAAELMHCELSVDFGLLLCSEALLEWYAKLGWERVPAAVCFDQPGVKLCWQEETMVLPCGTRPWPKGKIDFCGLPW